VSKKNYLKLTAYLCLIVLSGCQQMNDKRSQYVRNRSQDYLKSSVIAPLQVPEDLSLPAAYEVYPLPKDIPELGSLQPVSLIPPGFGSELN